MNYLGETSGDLVTLQTQGGDLKVSFEKEDTLYKNVWLIGPAKFVYKGTI